MIATRSTRKGYGFGRRVSPENKTLCIDARYINISREMFIEVKPLPGENLSVQIRATRRKAPTISATGNLGVHNGNNRHFKFTPANRICVEGSAVILYWGTSIPTLKLQFSFPVAISRGLLQLSCSPHRLLVLCGRSHPRFISFTFADPGRSYSWASLADRP